MIFDTDIIIWLQRGNKKAAKIIDDVEEKNISILTYMELFQCALSKEQHRIIRSFLQEFEFNVLPLSQNIGHRAAIYIEEYSTDNGLRSGDAIIAATAVENNLVLISGNAKYFRDIKDLDFKVFKP